MEGDQGGQLREAVKTILTSMFTKFRADSFDPYIANLQSSEDLNRFIDDIFNNMDALRIESNDILQLLRRLGAESSIKKGLGYNYYVLWLQFLLMRQIKCKNRISTAEIKKLSKSGKEQLQALKDIFKVYGSSLIEEQEITNFLEIIQNEPLFQEMLALQEEVIPPKESNIKAISNLSKLNSKQKSNIFLAILYQIYQKIQASNKTQDFQGAMEKIAELLDQILQRSYSFEREVLIGHLSQAILNILGIQIGKNNCIVHQQTIDSIKERFYNFQRFFDFQKLLIECDLKNVKIEVILDKMKFLLKDGMKNLWYWPTYDKQSFIIFLIEKCTQQDKIDNLVQILNSYTPNLTASIFDINEREFLQQILTQTSKKAKLGKLIKCFQQYVKDQNIDIDKLLKNGETYKVLLKVQRIPDSKIQQNWSRIKPEKTEDCFYIYCYRTRKRQQLYISLEDRDQLFDKFKDTTFYQEITFNPQRYSLNCKLTDQMAVGNYKSGKKNLLAKHESNVQYDGILNYGNVSKFQHLVKEFKWMIIIIDSWKQIRFNAQQNEHIAQEVIKNIKDQEKIFKIRLDKILVEVNLQAMLVNQLVNTSNLPNQSSMIKRRYGYLVYFPAYKTQKTALTIMSDSEEEEAIQSTKKEEEQQEEAIPEYEKQQTFDQKFEFLGVFRTYFHITHDFTIDQNENVIASNKSISYFKNWLNIELYSLMDQHLLQKEENFSKIPKDFKLIKKLYPKFKDQIQICRSMMKIRLNYQYEDKKQNLIIVNLKEQKQSREFYQVLMKYLILKISKQLQKKAFTLELENDQNDYLKQQKDLKVENLGNKIVEVICTKEQKQKLLKEVAALDQTHQFTYQDPEAYKLMKRNEAQYLKSINLTENQVGQDFFKVSMKLKDHPAFKQMLLKYHQKIEKQGGDNIQQKMEKQAQFLHIYQAQFKKQNIQIDVSKIGPDLLLQYKRKVEKAVNKALIKINEAKQRELFKISRSKGRQYAFANVQGAFIYKLKDKLTQTLRQTAKMGINPVIDVRMDNKNSFTLTALQITPDQEKIVQKQILNFENRFKEFLQGKKQILNTSKISNDIFNRIPNDKVQSKLIKDMRVDFKKHLGQLLNEIITRVTEKAIQDLQKQFSDFITKQKLSTAFITKQKAVSQKNILDQISKINIFELYLTRFLQQKSEQWNKPINKNIIFNDITPILRSTNDKFKDTTQKFTIKDLQSYFKSLNIFTVIYYGQQLPITQHLKQFNDLFQKNDVVLVKVGTGSGKSTVIPPYLVGLGYQKVVVTQPRRLPCSQIYTRVSNVFGEGICGYEVADAGEDRNNSLIYMTDGLLKMRAEYNFQELDKIDVLIIDEIHERSANIDILLLLLNEYYKIKKRKLKLVLCSATIDKSIGEILEDAHLRIATFEVSVQRHPITEHPIETGNILSRVLKLTASLEGDQQMLVFFSSVAQVKQMVNLLQKNNHKAYPVMAEQNPIEQARFLEIGQIFVATAIAETSLTFKNLRFAVDSQMSRWRKFNPVVELMQTQEDFSSNSSIAQRKGRLGRTCPGEYHYFVYPSHDLTTNRDHNRTELENNDLTSYIYELLLRKNASLRDVQLLMRKLNHNSSEFDQKFQYSIKILKDLNIIDSNNSLTNAAIKMKAYGNLGHPQHNYALYQASLNNCTIDMVYLISFLMLGINRSGEILKDLKSQATGGDLRTIHDFIANVAEKIDLNTINNRKQIKQKMKQNCSHIATKPWFSVIVRVMRKVKDLLKISQNNVTVSDWSVMVTTLLSSYKNKIFFNQSVFGGNKANYQKIRKEAFCFEQKEKESDETLYKIDLNSLTYQKDAPPPIVLSLNCGISPQNECVLSLCEVLDPSTVKEQIRINIIGCQCQSNYFRDTQPMNQEQLFQNLQPRIRNNYNFIGVNSNFPVMGLTGHFQSLSKAFSDFIDLQRRNGQLKIDLKIMLEGVVDKRYLRVQRDPMLAVISKEHSMAMLQKLTNYDMKKMFQTMKFSMFNNYGVQIQWDVSMAQTVLIVKNAKNLHVSKIIEKLYNFCRWFSDSQTICKEQFKIKPQFIEDTQFLARDDKDKIIERVNQIVDSKLDHHIIRGWANGSGPSTRYSRTGRMIAVCWVLTNVFNCVIKGGFVRDWVVNNDEVLPQGNLSNLLQPNPRNNFIEVVDDSVTPSDIDAELSNFTLLDKEKFIKQMKKIGIIASIEEDGWRKHVIFDQGVQTGGFTADLIEPYTTLCHDTYDFDVNILYIKKDHLSSIGQKIPLQYQDKYGKKIKVSLEQLLSQCRKKEMRKLKESMPDYRYTKFQARGWTINRDEVHQPLIYTDYTTKSAPMNPASIQSICPEFYQRMVVQKNCRIVRIESLKNKAWDDAFESVQHWIITEIEKTEGGQNINSNNRLLFHGSSHAGIEGIRQSGFDSRFFGQYGYYGRGAYFADDPQVSDSYASATNNCKEMFVVMVALGKQQKLTQQTPNKLGPSKGFHSIEGHDRGHGEYIIDRWGQAKILYLITYQ